MKYVRLGVIASKEELLSAAHRAAGHRKLQIAGVVESLIASESGGFLIERTKWDKVENGKIVRVTAAWLSVPPENDDPAGCMYILTDRSPRRDETSIWVAIVIEADGRTPVLLKFIDTFTGGAKEEDDLLQDALDRKMRGQIVL